MIGLLTASPSQPEVITMPMAVAVMRGNASPTSASVVGKMGAIAKPAQNTTTQAADGLLTCNMANVVMAIATEAPRVTARADTLMRIREITRRPTSSPRAKPRERILNAVDLSSPRSLMRYLASQFQTPTSQAM